MNNRYVSPFSERYASGEMQYIFSQENKFKTWRRLWLALAKAEKQLGLDITDEQIAELEQYKDDINFDVAKAREKEVRHDVMSHVYAYGRQAKNAAGIIHLGATSAYVVDNADMIIMKSALELVRDKLVNVIAQLSNFAEQYKALPTLGFTHLQPAQLTTVGKRATLWLNDLCMDLEEMEFRIESLKLLGSKGATGTQASFLNLFDGNAEKAAKLDELIAKEVGFNKIVAVSGQTYSRKTDYQVVSTVSAIAQSCSKFSYDLRILQSLKEIEEPFVDKQIGSSAMPYKRNPMKSERITALSRYVIVDQLNPAFTAATQWFERTLDDSANKRIAVPEAFLSIDGILDIMLDITSGLIVYPKVIEKHVMEELPFMATENIMMHAVKQGGDRQELHEKLRVHSYAAGAQVKEYGKTNDLVDRIANDADFSISKKELEDILMPINYIGLADAQTEDFIKHTVQPVLNKYKEKLGIKASLSV